MTVYFILLIVMTLLGSAASFFLKKASSSDGIFEILKNINLYIGGVLYLISAVINIILLKKMEYSIVLPLTSITYIWTMGFSYMMLKEKITKRKIMGVVLILIGAICVSI